ncbi:MAG: Flp family type IVb pilin [Hyphomicrobiales bacterium]|nr:Flp family type IVb pilin [Hyphomicrobiales bacterium]
MIRQLRTFLKDETGTTAVEYGFIAALIALVLAAGAASVGNEVGGLFNRTGNEMTNASR